MEKLRGLNQAMQALEQSKTTIRFCLIFHAISASEKARLACQARFFFLDLAGNIGTKVTGYFFPVP